MAELFEIHDRSRFELIAFSFGADTNDAMRERVMAAFDKFIDVTSQPDSEVAILVRSLKIDIAVDLGGHTGDNRMGIFSYRAAPIQVSYIGYPGTSGADYIDYLIADKTIIPKHSQQHYVEKIVYLPNSFQVNDRKRVISVKKFTREELGLPVEGFVFCCFNGSYKITPHVFDSWISILNSVTGSVLWLSEANQTAVVNLRKEAEKRGLDPQRLVFAKRMQLPEYLASYQIADLFLDTLPYNAGATASDALWAGLPVITCIGESFASRMAASLLTAINLPELITNTRAEYGILAIELATNRVKHQNIKNKLAANRLTTPLFDTPLFTRQIEDAYTEMYERYQNDLLPDHIEIKH
jgi:predicted O-linked N-acetylglucosamine transferase (SPINDLY family)